MAQDPVNIGTVANDGTGDTLRVAFAKLNANDAELFAAMAAEELTAAEILAKLLTVDGAGSGLDADLLDGQSSAAFAQAVHSHAQSEITGLTAALAAKLDASDYTAADVRTKLLTVDGAGSGIDADLLDGLSSAAFAAAAHAHAIADVTGLQAALDSKLAASAYTAADVLSKLLTVDGPGSGLDADTLDGVSSAGFAQASHTHAQSEVTGLVAALAAKGDLSSSASVSVDSELALFSGTTGKLVKRAGGSGLATLVAGVLSLTDPATFATAAHTHAIADTTGLQAALDAKLPSASYTAADVLSKLLTVDGTGSGLDADLLDGQSAAAFAAASHTHAQSEVTGLVAALAAKLDASSYTAADVLSKLLTVDGAASGLDADTLDGVSSAGFAAASHSHAIADVTGLQAALDTYTAADVLTKIKTVDGAGSGLDADLLDGQSSAAFAAASHTHAQADVTGLVAALAAKLDSSSYTAADVLAKLLTVDGAASGLDADLLDGLSSAAFLQTSSYQALTPTWSGLHTFTANVLHTSANPRLRVLETGLAADTGAWDINWDAGSMAIRTRTDADGTGQPVLSFTRPSGTQPLRLFTGGVDADLAGFSTTAGNVNNFTVVFSAFDITRNGNFALVSVQRPLFNLLKYAGTFASPTQIQNNTALHQLSFACYNTDTAAIANCVSLATTSTETWTSTAQGARLDARVTPNGTTTPVIVLRLAESQMLSLDGTAALPSRAFQSDIDTGDYRIASNQYGIACGGTLVLDLSTSIAAITATTVRLNTTSATTVGAAGGASALPATPLGYITANVNGTACKIPYYNT